MDNVYKVSSKGNGEVENGEDISFRRIECESELYKEGSELVIRIQEASKNNHSRVHFLVAESILSNDYLFYPETSKKLTLEITVPFAEIGEPSVHFSNSYTETLCLPLRDSKSNYLIIPVNELSSLADLASILEVVKQFNAMVNSESGSALNGYFEGEEFERYINLFLSTLPFINKIEED